MKQEKVLQSKYLRPQVEKKPNLITVINYALVIEIFAFVLLVIALIWCEEGWLIIRLFLTNVVLLLATAFFGSIVNDQNNV